MNLRPILTNLAVALAVGGIALTPAISRAGDDDKGKGKSKSKGSWNSGGPKATNRGWDFNRGKGGWQQRDKNDDWRDRYDDNRRNDDWRRRQEDQRRWEEQRRRAEDQYRREDQRRRDAERQRWEDQRRRDEWNRNNSGRYDDRNYRYDDNRRQQTKNEWRNLAIAGGIVAFLGILNEDSTLTFAGAAGALYSLNRYEQDRKSQNRYNRARAYYFSQDYFYRDGQRFDRRLVTKNGQRYYQFCRS